MTPSSTSFPKNFLWGAASSAHQVEGNNHNDWTEWEKLGLVRSGDVSGRATGHYQRFREDFGLAAKLGHTAHRFSLEWSRIEPQPGRFDLGALDHYRQVLTELRRLKLEPLVTLHHFTNPLWVRDWDGWLSPRTVDAFGNYVLTVVRELGAFVRYWITMNEPTVYTSLGYISGYWPPQRRNYLAAWRAIRNMSRAHDLAYRIIHRHNPDARVGVANNLSDFVPARPGHWLDRAQVAFADYWHNRWWLNQTYGQQDFIGLNYYFHHPLRFRFTTVSKLFAPEPPDDLPRTDTDWPIHPAGLGRVLDSLRTYRRPIIITENGLADSADAKRASFIRAHVAELAAARQRGIDVEGYIYWSLTDNFEWREGFAPRFGLVAIDYGTLRRTTRPSAYTFRQICQQNGPV